MRGTGNEMRWRQRSLARDHQAPSRTRSPRRSGANGGHVSEPNGNTPPPKDGANGAGDNSADKPEYVTKADLTALFDGLKAELPKMVGNAANAASKSQLDRQLKALGLTPETLAKLTPPKEEPADESAAGDDENKDRGKRSSAPNKRPDGGDVEALIKSFEDKFAAQSKQIESLKKTASEETRKREEAERRRLDQQGLTTARSTIEKHVRKGAAGLALDALRGRGLVQIADDGTPQFKGAADDGPIEFEQGLKDFLRTEEGQVFVPPPQPSGGNRGTRPTPFVNGGNGAGPSGEHIDQAFAAKHGVTPEHGFFSG